LKAFGLADALVIALYRATKTFPREELFGLTSQIRRAAVSVCSNIAEGCARETQNEYLHFLNQAFGSLREVGYYIDLSSRLAYLSQESAEELLKMYDETARVLGALNASLRTRDSE